MAKQNDAISSLINPLYFKMIKNAVVKHGRINVQALSEKFNILPGNTYFRNFIKDNDQEYLGTNGLKSILNACGYTIRLVPVKKSDIDTMTYIEKLTAESFTNISEKVSNESSLLKRPPKKEKKKGPKTITNAKLINDSIMGISSDDINDIFDDDNDDLIVGTFDDLDDLPDIEIDPIKLAEHLKNNDL